MILVFVLEEYLVIIFCFLTSFLYISGAYPQSYVFYTKKDFIPFYGLLFSWLYAVLCTISFAKFMQSHLPRIDIISWMVKPRCKMLVVYHHIWCHYTTDVSTEITWHFHEKQGFFAMRIVSGSHGLCLYLEMPFLDGVYSK